MAPENFACKLFPVGSGRDMRGWDGRQKTRNDWVPFLRVTGSKLRMIQEFDINELFPSR